MHGRGSLNPHGDFCLWRLWWLCGLRLGLPFLRRRRRGLLLGRRRGNRRSRGQRNKLQPWRSNRDGRQDDPALTAEWVAGVAARRLEFEANLELVIGTAGGFEDLDQTAVLAFHAFLAGHLHDVVHGDDRLGWRQDLGRDHAGEFLQRLACFLSFLELDHGVLAAAGKAESHAVHADHATESTLKCDTGGRQVQNQLQRSPTGHQTG